MTGCYIHVWLCLFSVFARVTEVKMETTLRRVLYSRVELTGETLDQHTADSLHSVEWSKLNKSSSCQCFRKHNNSDTHYSRCCGKAHFYLNNNSLILENVTAQDEGVFTEKIITREGKTESKNFTLIIEYPPNATEIIVSWTSNTSVTLRCEVNGSFLHLMWKREGVSFVDEDRHSFSDRNQTLHIRNISRSDYATYSCIVSSEYGTSERHTQITGMNSAVNQGNGTSGKSQIDQTVLSIALALTGVSGLFVIVIYCLYKPHHSQRAENGRTTDEGNPENGPPIYQEVGGTEEVIPLPYVYSDFIKPKESSQTSTAAQYLEDFGYSEVGPHAQRTQSSWIESLNKRDTGEE